MQLQGNIHRHLCSSLRPLLQPFSRFQWSTNGKGTPVSTRFIHHAPHYNLEFDIITRLTLFPPTTFIFFSFFATKTPAQQVKTLSISIHTLYNTVSPLIFFKFQDFTEQLRELCLPDCVSMLF